MKSPIHRRTLVVNGLLGVLLVGGAGYGYASLKQSGGGQAVTGGVGTVRRGTLLSSVSATGSVASATTQALSFGASGTVTKIEVQTGDRVRKGDVLARLDDTTARENVTVAKAALDAASAANAAATSTNSAQTYSAYVTAKNTYDDAVRTLNGCVLTAPFSGTVIAINGNVGGSAAGGGSSSSSSGGSSGSGSGASGGNGGSSRSSGSANAGSSGSSSSSSTSSSGFLTLADPGHLEVTGQFTEADTTKLKIGQTASVSFDALPGTTASGKVTAIDSSATTSNNVVQYGVTVALDSPPPGIRLGQTTSVQVIVAKADNVLYVPPAAVRTAGGVSTVIVRKANGTQVTRTVQIGLKGDSGTEITSGLAEGESVVLAAASGTGGSQFGGRGLGGIGGIGGGAGGGTRIGGGGGGRGGGG